MTFLTFAHQLADKASLLAHAYFRAPLDTTFKSGGYPVTAADLAIETALRAAIQDTFPEHGILGEEYGSTHIANEYVWVIDPIDGTSSFTCGKPTFCTLIALLQHGKPVLGVIDQPILKERWVGIAGQLTTWNTTPCPRSDTTIDCLRLNCTTPAMFVTDSERAAFERIKSNASIVTYGGDAYAYGLLASGHIDVIMEADLQYYDVAALIPIIEGAGGIITDWTGQPLEQSHFRGKVLACRSPTCHAHLLSMLAS